MQAPPLAVYVHFPWCVSKCPYCDFNSHQLKSALPEAAYLEALAADLAAQLLRVAGREVCSVFLGGGTPSLFAPSAIGEVLALLRARLPFAPDAEITMEANPATIERGRFAGYRDAGVNRVSLGAQSFGAAQLAALGRIHKVEDVLRSVDELRRAGLVNFNLDLMFALPQQGRELALADLAAALALAPSHLSLYQLTIEPGTVFAGHPPPLPNEEECEAMQADAQALLGARGYAQYEVSAWAQAGFQCRHNRNYWSFGDYLGLGAGAHGKLTHPGRGLIERSAHPREPRRYQAGAAQGPRWQAVAAADLPFEFMMNALRLNEGFTAADFSARTGLDPAVIAPSFAQLAARGLAEPLPTGQGPGWRATALGHRFLNDVTAVFLPAPISQDGAGS
ncbi:MAG: radical SAM family heme chaperone HemW [Steroidobacteraceae bacterium]